MKRILSALVLLAGCGGAELPEAGGRCGQPEGLLLDASGTASVIGRLPDGDDRLGEPAGCGDQVSAFFAFTLSEPSSVTLTLSSEGQVEAGFVDDCGSTARSCGGSVRVEAGAGTNVIVVSGPSGAEFGLGVVVDRADAGPGPGSQPAAGDCSDPVPVSVDEDGAFRLRVPADEPLPFDASTCNRSFEPHRVFALDLDAPRALVLEAELGLDVRLPADPLCQANEDDVCLDFASSDRFVLPRLDAGRQLILVPAEPDMDVEIDGRLEEPRSPPPNSVCEDAAPIELDTEIELDFPGAEFMEREGFCYEGYIQYFAFELPPGRQVRVERRSSGVNVEYLDMNCQLLSAANCFEDCSERLVEGGLPPGRYIARVSLGAEEAIFLDADLELSLRSFPEAPPPPPNDTCENAEVWPLQLGPNERMVDFAGATPSGREADLWFRVAIPADVEIELDGSLFWGDFFQSCADAAAGRSIAGEGRSSALPAGSYLLQVSWRAPICEESGGTSQVGLRLRSLPPPPVNDSCASPQVAFFGAGNLARIEGSLEAARADHEQIDCGSGLSGARAQGPELVHSFEVDVPSVVRFFQLEGEADVEVHLLPDCEGADGLVCFQSFGGLEDGVELAPGTYFLRVETRRGPPFQVPEGRYAFLIERIPL